MIQVVAVLLISVLAEAYVPNRHILITPKQLHDGNAIAFPEFFGGMTMLELQKNTLGLHEKAACHYQGTIAGRPGSAVAASVCGGIAKMTALIFYPNKTRVVIEPRKAGDGLGPSTHTHAAFRFTDMLEHMHGSGDGHVCEIHRPHNVSATSTTASTFTTADGAVHHRRAVRQQQSRTAPVSRRRLDVRTDIKYIAAYLVSDKPVNLSQNIF